MANVREFPAIHAVVVDPHVSANVAALHYISHPRGGIIEKGAPGRFHFIDSAGKRVKDSATLACIKSLVIPPAWRNVWICPSANGHLQAIRSESAR